MLLSLSLPLSFSLPPILFPSLSLSLSVRFRPCHPLCPVRKRERESERERKRKPERERESEREREARCTHTGVEGAVQGYRYGQVEPLVLLNLITSGPGGDRYFRVSFPGNRPRDSAARHILYAFRLVDPIYNPVHPSVRPSVRPFVRSSIRPILVPRSLRSFVRSFARFINRPRPSLRSRTHTYFFSLSLSLFFSPPFPPNLSFSTGRELNPRRANSQDREIPSEFRRLPTERLVTTEARRKRGVEIRPHSFRND